MTGVAGLYRDRAAWIFPVPEIPVGKHEQAMCNRYFSFRREYDRDRCFLLSFILRGVADKWFFLFRFANLYGYSPLFFSEPFSPVGVAGLVFFPEGGRGMDRGMEIRRYGDGG